jgi:hypothetical protein
MTKISQHRKDPNTGHSMKKNSSGRLVEAIENQNIEIWSFVYH